MNNIFDYFKQIESKRVEVTICNNKLLPFLEFPLLIKSYSEFSSYILLDNRDGKTPIAFINLKPDFDFTVEYKNKQIYCITIPNYRIVVKNEKIN